jgi:hypothetical protein
VALYLDHAFITCDPGAPEAEVLLRHGLIEGSSNVHGGQGTANRRFFFENFMLELVWVSDPSIAASEAIRPAQLWDRWSQRQGGASRFGIIFVGQAPEGSQSPLVTQSYIPPYLPPGMRFEIAQGFRLDEPSVIWIPTTNSGRSRPQHEPPSIPGARICGLTVGVSDPKTLSPAATRVQQAGLLDFIQAPAPLLVVRFSAPKDLLLDCRPVLPLILQGMQGAS